LKDGEFLLKLLDAFFSLFAVFTAAQVKATFRDDTLES
jgi:hypothetical protein